MPMQKRPKPKIQHLNIFGITGFCKTGGFYIGKIHLVKSLLLLVFILLTSNSFAWVFPEHRQIALLAIQNLNPLYRLLLDQLWTEATKGYSNRLTESVIDPGQNNHSA